ncbi:MAG TPA: VWA domain-containing protein [Gemmataceae bacterium]|nr:VWA domain-containing protein [Gemmataceae bacterium]
MRVRHRIPTIFNLSMVDVLCCALGCVILLWLFNLHDARQRAVTVGETTERLRDTQAHLDQTTSQLQSVLHERDDLVVRAAASAKERDQVRRELELARGRMSAIGKELGTVKKQKDALSQEERALTREKADMDQRLTALEDLLRKKDAQAKSSARRLNDLTEQLQDAASRSKSLSAEVLAYRTRLADAEGRAKTMQAQAGNEKKDLAEANHAIEILQGEQKDLRNKLERAQAAVENRFEGIMLTGRRVLFLVDMSGSMDLVDERTPDANKWLGVRQALAKVMRSLPELEKFQVIVFSDNFSYLLGSDGRWLDFDPKASVERAVQALAATKPTGSTNMHDAFQAAFRFRASGLDTIYVFSDGLPNSGAGLTNEQANSLNETDRSSILAKHIRNLLRRDWNREIAGQARVRINTIGFFYESPDVGAFLWALARENDGSFVGMSKP